MAGRVTGRSSRDREYRRGVLRPILTPASASLGLMMWSQVMANNFLYPGAAADSADALIARARAARTFRHFSSSSTFGRRASDTSMPPNLASTCRRSAR